MAAEHFDPIPDDDDCIHTMMSPMDDDHEFQAWLSRDGKEQDREGARLASIDSEYRDDDPDELAVAASEKELEGIMENQPMNGDSWRLARAAWSDMWEARWTDRLDTALMRCTGKKYNKSEAGDLLKQLDELTRDCADFYQGAAAKGWVIMTPKAVRSRVITCNKQKIELRERMRYSPRRRAGCATRADRAEEAAKPIPLAPLRRKPVDMSAVVEPWLEPTYEEFKECWLNVTGVEGQLEPWLEPSFEEFRECWLNVTGVAASEKPDQWLEPDFGEFKDYWLNVTGVQGELEPWLEPVFEQFKRGFVQDKATRPLQVQPWLTASPELRKGWVSVVDNEQAALGEFLRLEESCNEAVEPKKRKASHRAGAAWRRSTTATAAALRIATAVVKEQSDVTQTPKGSKAEAAAAAVQKLATAAAGVRAQIEAGELPQTKSSRALTDVGSVVHAVMATREPLRADTACVPQQGKATCTTRATRGSLWRPTPRGPWQRRLMREWGSAYHEPTDDYVGPCSTMSCEYLTNQRLSRH
eukprot:TRINITY_DN49531_c0_g1_i1.p1 TRINITY_DN49531_c0_g1~~TRINITY_DN49531_c0_g1_i1.p1  ORF type:complete len:528 (+),score=121.26 TRINITY_DN49531_c0_g1_i1:197-1780(+)